jgi:probable HAF family extracellular repeat protein
MFRRLIAVSLLALGALAVQWPAVSQTPPLKYYVTDLGVIAGADTSSPNGINDNGWVVGHTPLSRSVSYSRGWVWAPSSPNSTQGALSTLKAAHPFPDPLAYEVCSPAGINNGGLIVGTSSSRDSTKVPCATYWLSPSAPVDFNTLLPEPREWTLTGASDVSEPGAEGELYVCGLGRHVSDPVTDAGIVWRVDGGVITRVTRLEHAPGLINPRSFATEMNSRGQMTGSSRSTPAGATYHPYLWETNGTGQYLGDLGTGSTSAFALNDAGDVVGTDTSLRKGWVWSSSTGTMATLPTLGGSESFATGINNLSQIVGFAFSSTGQKACLWQNGIPYDLNKYKVAGATKTTLFWAQVINNRGAIAAIYSGGKGTRCVLMTPQ